jgi:hypothetical protein
MGVQEYPHAQRFLGSWARSTSGPINRWVLLVGHISRRDVFSLINRHLGK